MLNCILDSFVVYSESVDYGFVSGETEASRLGIAVLGLRCQGADLHKAETEVSHVIVKFPVLVKSSRKSYRVGKVYSENLTLKGFVFLFIYGPRHGAGKRYAPKERQGGKCHVVCRLRIEPEQNRLHQMLVHVLQKCFGS